MKDLTGIGFVQDGGGRLAYMLFWQSLDGRLEVVYFDTYKDAHERFIHLQSLGRKPKLYRELAIL